MKAIGKWLARVVGTALALVLFVTLLPYVSRLADQFLPDLSDQALTASATLAQRFQESVRLEVANVEEDGVLSSSTDALFLGTVQRVTIQYLYKASLGVDLRQAEVSVDGGTLTVTLPPLEVLSDSVTPQTIERDDFWYPLTDEQRERLLEDERQACRTRVLEQYSGDEGWQTVCSALDHTIAGWIGNAAALRISYRQKSAEP